MAALPFTTGLTISEIKVGATFEQLIHGATGGNLFIHTTPSMEKSLEADILPSEQPRVKASSDSDEAVLAVRSSVSSRGGTRPTETPSTLAATSTPTIPVEATPSATAELTATIAAIPTSTPTQTSTPVPTDTPEAASESVPIDTDAPVPTATPEPADIPVPTETPAPTVPANPTASLCPTPTASEPDTPPTSQEPQAPTAPEPMEVTGDTISAIAMEYVGYGYAWGGSSPGVGFDCSGFIGYVCQEAGVPVPNHDLYGQLNAGPSIEMEQLQPGDLVFFQNTYTAGLSHGGIYIGGGQFVHAVDDGVGVKVTNIGDQYWASRFVGASRPAAVGSR